MERRILIGTPSINGRRKKASEVAVQCAMLEASGLHWDCEDFIRACDSVISNSRNVLFGKFMAGNYTDMLWLDSDVGIGPGCFTRLMQHPVDFVAAVPRTKYPVERYPVRWLADMGQHVDPAHGLRQAEGVPFGCVRITRAVGEKMVEAHKHLSYRVGDADHPNWCIFDHVFRDGQYWGEDFVFCQRWRALGGAVWVDAEIPTTHVRRKGESYSGHLGNWLRANRLIPHGVAEVAAKLSQPNPDGADLLAKSRKLIAGAKTIVEIANERPQPRLMLVPSPGVDYGKLFADALGETA